MTSNNSYNPLDDTVSILMTGLLPVFVFGLFKGFEEQKGIKFSLINIFDDFIIFSSITLYPFFTGVQWYAYHTENEKKLILALSIIGYLLSTNSTTTKIVFAICSISFSRLVEHFYDNEPKKINTMISIYLNFHGFMVKKAEIENIKDKLKNILNELSEIEDQIRRLRKRLEENRLEIKTKEIKKNNSLEIETEEKIKKNNSLEIEIEEEIKKNISSEIEINDEIRKNNTFIAGDDTTTSLISFIKFMVREPKITPINKITTILSQHKTRQEDYLLENIMILKEKRIELDNIPSAVHGSTLNIPLENFKDSKKQPSNAIYWQDQNESSKSKTFGDVIYRNKIGVWLKTLVDEPKTWCTISWEDWVQLYKTSPSDDISCNGSDCLVLTNE
ncbi:13925_t:CDS:2 [Cetraspora pellucida]|uniref:13925_t:CDS:1 n=1 Tax=Cetraspora pellucida TaxID=1433469 RepID=A0ACA9M2B8_9GLOM|nr:13925_t:CDS:2 [Cetraspora pellucida]